MAISRMFHRAALAVMMLELLVSTESRYSINDDLTPVEEENRIPVAWRYRDNASPLTRRKRHEALGNEIPQIVSSDNKYQIGDLKCRENLRRLCGEPDNSYDQLFLLECVQTFKPNELASIGDGCQHAIWSHTQNVTTNENIQRLAQHACGKELEPLQCSEESTQPGAYLSCLIERRDQVRDEDCLAYIQRLEWIAFSDFRIVAPMISDCRDDIHRFECGKIQQAGLYKEHSQGQMLECLQSHVDKLEKNCKKRIFRISEIQGDNIKLDRQLYLACTQDHIQFCGTIRPGTGQVYKCLMQHKTDRSMTKQCREQLTRREKLIASDYRVSKGLVKACKEDIKNNHCRRSVSEDREIRLGQILLCLESVARNGSKIDPECQVEMFDHRKLLMEDYRLSPEIVNDCAEDISKLCNGLEVGGLTIHCLMEHTKPRKKRVMDKCRRALEDLIKEADAGEDWRVDPVLKEACQPVVDVACKDVRGGDARVIYCLMDKLGTDKMTEACETALVQIQYFVARDYKLDPQLYRACKSDAIQYCNAKRAWSDNGVGTDPERGPLVLPCLYRNAYQPSNITLRRECLDEIRRVMRQRAVNVDLQPEIEDACLNELAKFCFDKTAKGEEVLCLQDHLEELENRDCKLAVSNFTAEQAERVELNPLIMTACQRIAEQYCSEQLRLAKDEGDIMECLIEHKNDLNSRTDYKCKAAVEHFQLLSLKSYHFTYKFKEACRPLVMRHCRESTTKAAVIECLSGIVQEDAINDKQPRIPKDCRQQLRMQLYQQRENIRFDPALQKACVDDINKFCSKIEPGNSQVVECLATHKAKLSDVCHRQLFKVRRQEFQDSSSDVMLLNSCRSMIKYFCWESDRAQALDCLKAHKDEPNFDDKCKNIVIRRMIEQNTDYRFNGALQSACSKDIASHCSEVLKQAKEKDKELEGKVISCLKIQFRQWKLTTKCEQQMAHILRQTALNYHLDPLLSTMCAHEIVTICREEDKGPGAVEECLKTEFNAGNPEMKEACRVQIADLIEESRADINVDPLLHKACAVDLKQYCSDIPQGAGRHIMCLQNVLDSENSKKSLQPDCYKMLTARIEMFRNAAKLVEPPKTIGEFYTTVNSSPSRSLFIIVILGMITLIFIIGLLCGRVTRRSMMMKNK